MIRRTSVTTPATLKRISHNARALSMPENTMHLVMCNAWQRDAVYRHLELA